MFIRNRVEVFDFLEEILSHVRVTRFSDTELQVILGESLYQATGAPVDCSVETRNEVIEISVETHAFYFHQGRLFLWYPLRKRKIIL